MSEDDIPIGTKVAIDVSVYRNKELHPDPVIHEYEIIGPKKTWHFSRFPDGSGIQGRYENAKVTEYVGYPIRRGTYETDKAFWENGKQTEAYRGIVRT